MSKPLTFEQAKQLLSRDERFRAAVYAMNLLLLEKQIYTGAEFEQVFIQAAERERNRRKVSSKNLDGGRKRTR